MKRDLELPPEQQAIRDKCFHPSGRFVAFPIEDVETSVCTRFEKMVAQYSNNWAIITDSKSLTYAELNERANRVARSIVERLDAGSEPIALLFDSKLALIVAMLATLKAGKFIISLDAASPLARRLAIVNDTRSRLVLTEAALHAKALELYPQEADILNIDTCSNGCVSNLQLPIGPETPLAISYTGGSTGAPKGVIANHRNLLHHAMLFANTFHYCDEDRISYLVSGSNAALHHPFMTLLAGASLFPFDVKRFGVDTLGAWLRQTEITICSLSAPLLRVWVNGQTPRLNLPNLRVLRLSSEASYKTDFVLYREQFPQSCLLVNGIGPTETSFISFYLMDHESVIDTDEIPIGYPVQDKEISLVDDDGREVGFDQVGEIAVRSAYLSQGYWNRPELTAAKFTTANGGAVRTYFTGDLGLRRSDGCLIYKGRKDFRVKIRGYGVEPAEVEASIRQHPAIREVCVTAMDDGASRDRRLVAYFTRNSDQGLSVSELRTFLKQRLPDYMIPAAFVSMTKLPLRPNGKIDRSALPTPVFSRSGSNAPYVTPRNEQECRLTEIFCDVLRLVAAGTGDNFFDLGGDSLSAMRIVSRVKREFHIDLLLSEFYESPTISSLAALLQRCPRGRSQNRTVALQPIARIEPLPLSFEQERLWFLDQLEPHARRYNLVGAFRLEGKLDLGALEQSINQIVKRHESLRTVFRSNDGKPYAVVLDAPTISLSTVYIESLCRETADQAPRRICAEEASRPFDLTGGPLFRPTLVKSNGTPIALLLVIHHLVFDGWSMDILCRELSANYNAALARQSFEVAPLPIQYADFAIWQRDANQQQSFDADLVFWREELAEAPVLRLPTDRPRPQFRNGRATRQWFTIAPSVTQLLKDTSREVGATVFMTLLAVYQTLLFRYSNQGDFCVGVPVAGRTDDALDDLIGYFLNMLVVRADLSGNPSFNDFLSRVRHRCLEAYSHQHVPFELIVEHLQPQRVINQNPLFQVSFTLRPGGACALHLKGLAVQELEVDPGTSRFDLELYMEERDGGLHGFLAGSSDLFDRSTVERMLGHFQVLLEAVAANPDRRLSELPILTEAEQHQLLVEWNETKRDYPKDKCLHQLFEEQVKRTPDFVAVVFEGQQLTYEELNKRANHLAHYLRKIGVGPGTLVGICVERSMEMVVGLLGIVKAGAAYVPLDPQYTKERLGFMLQDAKVRVLLTQQGLPEILSQDTARVIYLDTDWIEVSKESDENPAAEMTAENLAYVIYTSGSTGQPKGAMIHHRGLCNRLHWMQETYQLSPSDRVLQKTPFSFDVSIWEFFWPLITGSQVVIARPGGHQDPRYLIELIKEREITTVHFVPSMLELFLEDSQVDTCKTIRRVICSGETLSYDLQQRFFERSSAELYNLYGPTEASIDVMAWKCQRDSDTKIVPIGRPIANTQIYILDSHLQPVPIGVTGKIHIGGEGLARGYLNRPELTAEKFIANPFSDEPGARLYKTGDVGRYLPDGNIEFLGRLDDQVKIRGYRIELGEIEAVLRQHPSVRDTVVLAREDSPGDKRLVAYVVGGETKVDELRSFLKQKLPEYMVPSSFVCLEAFPLTPNGKVDRKALPVPDQTRPETAKVYVAPCTPTEEILPEIWAEVLKLDKVSIHDNFFDLGGHSLLATRVVARLGKILNAEIPLRFLFEAPTIHELALRIMAQKEARLPKVESPSEEQAPQHPSGEEGRIII